MTSRRAIEAVGTASAAEDGEGLALRRVKAEG